jgi:hypothetical protein
MSHFSVSNLKPIFSTPLSVDLARGQHVMTDEQAKHRIVVALHEAAHLVASIACPSTSILGVGVYAPFKAQNFFGRGCDGEVRSMSVYPEHDAFINFVGVAWEELHGDLAFADVDLQAGFRYAKSAVESGGTALEKAEEILDKARSFVIVADRQIRVAAVGLLGLIPKHGELKRPKTAHLVNALRPTIPRYGKW